MRKEDVPQDPSFYKGLKRVCFAVDEDEHYAPATSAGWSVERLVTEQALLQLEQEVEGIRQAVIAGQRAPLAYHMAARQMTAKLFAQHVGVSTWRIKRQLRPKTFQKLETQVLQRYARCLDLSLEVMLTVPDQPKRVFFEDSSD